MKPRHIAYVLNHLWDLTPISVRSVSQCIRKKHNHEIYPNNNLQFLTIKLSKKKLHNQKKLYYSKNYINPEAITPRKIEREKESQWFYHQRGCHHGRRGYLGSQEPMGSWGLGSVNLGSHVQLKLGGLDVAAEAAWSLQLRCHRCRRHLG